MGRVGVTGNNHQSSFLMSVDSLLDRFVLGDPLSISTMVYKCLERPNKPS